MNLAANRDFGLREVTDKEPYCKKLDALEQAVIQELQTANQEIEATGEVSQELKQRIFTLMPSLEDIWPQLEMIAQEQLEEPDRSKLFRKFDPNSAGERWPEPLFVSGFHWISGCFIRVLGVMTPVLYRPVLDCFLRGLPHLYHNVEADDGTALLVEISGDCGGCWRLSKRGENWKFVNERSERISARVTIPQEIAWRVFTKGISRESAEAHVRWRGTGIWPAGFSNLPPSSLSRWQEGAG